MEGYSATAGPELPQSSYKVDSVVTYVDRWMWDITLYLLELTVTFRDAANGFPLVVGNSYHTSLTRKSPEEMVDEVVTNILNTSKTNQTRRSVNRLRQNDLPCAHNSYRRVFFFVWVRFLPLELFYTGDIPGNGSYFL